MGPVKQITIEDMTTIKDRLDIPNITKWIKAIRHITVNNKIDHLGIRITGTADITRVERDRRVDQKFNRHGTRCNY